MLFRFWVFPDCTFLDISTIFVWENKLYIVRCRNVLTFVVYKSDFVFITGIAIRQKFAVIDYPAETDFIKNGDAVYIRKKVFSCFFVSIERFNKFCIHLHCGFVNGIA